MTILKINNPDIYYFKNEMYIRYSSLISRYSKFIFPSWTVRFKGKKIRLGIYLSPKPGFTRTVVIDGIRLHGKDLMNFETLDNISHKY